MNKIKLKRKIKPINFIALFLIIFIICTFLVFNYIKTRIMPSLFKYGSLEAKKFSSIIINDAVEKYMTDEINVDNLFIITNDNNGEIKSVDFNTSLINKYLTNATKSIQKNLKYIEKGDLQKVEYKASLLDTYDEKALKNGVIYYLNSGFIFNNPIFANFGKQIPIKISLTGDVISNISTDLTNYGINNALIKVYANIKITENLILPFYNKNIELETKVPIALKIVNGTVPNYYGNLNTTTPSITLPNE